MKKLLYVGSMRGLLIFLLVNKLEVNDTIFIFENKNNINLQNKITLDLENRKNENKYLKRYKIYKIFKKASEESGGGIWLQDHLLYAEYFISKFKNIKLLEDGLLNYDLDNEKELKKRLKIKDWILGGSFLVDENKFGISKNISEIYLTGLKEIPKKIINKTKIIDLKKLWSELSFEKKEKLFNIFNLKGKILLNKEIILITQPLSEDGAITENEKINIYKNIVDKYGEENIIIKPHPREKTNYKDIFPKTEVLTKEFPIELITFTMKNIKKVITIFSTAVYDFENVAEEIEFVGTKIDDKLVKKFGNIER